MNRSGNPLRESRATCLWLASEMAAAGLFLFRHRSGMPIVPFAVLATLGLAAALILSGFAVPILARRYSLPARDLLGKLALALSPLLLLVVDLVQEKFVLRDISPVLLLLALGGSAYLLFVLHFKLSRPEAPLPGGRPLPRRILLLVFFASFTVYSFVLLSGLLPPLPFTGDEPHYLLVTKSLVRDGDIDLNNNYRNQDYLEFYPGTINWHAYPGRKGPTHLFSKHFPALPVLLVPAYWCAEWLGKIIPGPGVNLPTARNIHILMARQTMTLLAALLVTLFFLLVWETTGSPRVTFHSWLFFAFSPPILFYSQLLYAELPVALILLWILRRGVFKQDTTRISLLGIGLGIGAIPWFGIKYSILAAAVFVSVVYANWKTIAAIRRRILFLLGPMLFSGALYSAFLLRIYGTLLPFAVYKGALAAHANMFGRYFGFHWEKFFAAAASYFLDQRAGILLYSPLYTLFIPGIVFFIRKSKKKGLAALLAILPYWGLCALGYFHGGYAPPGRPLLPGVAILALFVAAALAWTESRFALAVFRSLAILTVLIVLLTVLQPHFLYHEGLSADSWNSDTQAHLLTHFSNAGIDLARLAPNLIYMPKFSWPVLLFWMALIAGLSLAVLRKEKKPAPDRPLVGIGIHVSCILMLSLLLTAYHFFNVRLDDRKRLDVPNGMVFFQDQNSFGPELGGFWTRGGSRTEVVLRTPAAVRRLRLELSGPVAVKARLRIGQAAVPLSNLAPGAYSADATLEKPRGLPWKGGFLYLIRLEVAGGFVPSRIDPANADPRFLGLFVRIFPAGD
jgi:hypothetical protein